MLAASDCALKTSKTAAIYRELPKLCALLSLWAWSKSYLHPLGDHQRREANKRAEALEIYNAVFVAVYQLPPELELIVLRFLPMVDVLSLCLTSRRYASLIQRCATEEPNISDYQELNHRLERDRYFKLVEAESRVTSIETLDELLCSHCQRPHKKFLFQQDEHNKSGHIRKCIGLTATFRVCEHTSLSYEDILDRLATGKSISCLTRRYAIGCRLDPIVYRDQATGNVQHTCETVLRKTSLDVTLDRSDRLLAIQHHTEPICPHMRTSEAELQERIVNSSARLVNPYKHHGPIAGVMVERSTTLSMRLWCLTEACDTSVEIDKRLIGGLDAQIIIRVNHNLGKLETPWDAAWLAQIGDGRVWC